MNCIQPMAKPRPVWGNGREAGFNLMEVRGDPDRMVDVYVKCMLDLRTGVQKRLGSQLSVPDSEAEIVFILTHSSFTLACRAAGISSSILFTSHFWFIS